MKAPVTGLAAVAQDPTVSVTIWHVVMLAHGALFFTYGYMFLYRGAP